MQTLAYKYQQVSSRDRNPNPNPNLSPNPKPNPNASLLQAAIYASQYLPYISCISLYLT